MSKGNMVSDAFVCMYECLCVYVCTHNGGLSTKKNEVYHLQKDNETGYQYKVKLSKA